MKNEINCLKFVFSSIRNVPDKSGFSDRMNSIVHIDKKLIILKTGDQSIHHNPDGAMLDQNTKCKPFNADVMSLWLVACTRYEHPYECSFGGTIGLCLDLLASAQSSS